MKIKYSAKEVDRGWKKIRAFAKRVGQGKTYVKVGYLGPSAIEAHPDTEGLTVVALATIHEFGAPEAGIPERSHVRAVFDQKRAEYQALIKRLLPRVYGPKATMTEEKLLGIIGAKMAVDIRNYVTRGSGVPPPNAPATLKRKLEKTRPGSKGAPRTLVDTGRMIGALTWLVVAGGVESGPGK